MPDNGGRIPQPNYTQVPNVVLDEYLPEATPAEAKVLLWLCRSTFGWHRDWTDSRYSSLAQIVKRTGLSKQGVINSLKALHSRQLVRWRIDPETSAKAYSLRLVDEQPQAEVPTQPSTLSRPEAVHSVDQPGTLSRPEAVHSVDHVKETGKDRPKDSRKNGSASSAASPSRVCGNAACGKDLDGLDLRYRYCSTDCRKQAHAAERDGVTRDPRVPVLMRSYQEQLGYVPDPYEANAAAAKVLLQTYEPACILATYEALKQPGGYWSSRPLSLMSLRKQIGPALAEGKVPGWRLRDGEAVEVDEQAARRNGRETGETNAKALGMLIRSAERDGDEQRAAELREQLEAATV